MGTRSVQRLAAQGVGRIGMALDVSTLSASGLFWVRAAVKGEWESRENGDHGFPSAAFGHNQIN